MAREGEREREREKEREGGKGGREGGRLKERQREQMKISLWFWTVRIVGVRGVSEGYHYTNMQPLFVHKECDG